MHDHAVESELSHGMMIQNTENDSKILKFEALCTETCKLSLEAMRCYMNPLYNLLITPSHFIMLASPLIKAKVALLVLALHWAYFLWSEVTEN